MQGDLFDDKRYYYDLHSDIANLGPLRDTLQAGETFDHNGVTWEIIEREDFNQCFAVKKVDHEYFG
jgi:hypothetical protein